MEKMRRVVANTYLNDPDTIPVVVNTIVLMVNYGMLILIKLLLNDRTVYFINTWEQMRYLMIYLVLITAINYCRVVLMNKYMYLVSQEKVRKLHIYRINVMEIQRLENEMKGERDNYNLLRHLIKKKVAR